MVCYSPCRNFFEKIVFLTYLFGSKLCDSGFCALGLQNFYSRLLGLKSFPDFEPEKDCDNPLMIHQGT